MSVNKLTETFLSSELPLEPLLSASRGLGCVHLSLFGSALRQPLGEVGDVDLHLVMPHLDRSTFAALSAAAATTALELAEQAGCPCRVELRHGPLKPAPGVPRRLQLHLLIDDQVSLARLSRALLAQRALTGRLLAGEPLPGRWMERNEPDPWLQEARTELNRWHGALGAREIAIRSWVFDPGPRLAEGRLGARTSWDLGCLLRGAATTSDLHYRAAALIAAPRLEGAERAEDLARPLLAQLGAPPWQTLARRWKGIRDQAMAIVERRLDHISRLLELSVQPDS